MSMPFEAIACSTVTPAWVTALTSAPSSTATVTASRDSRSTNSGMLAATYLSEDGCAPRSPGGLSQTLPYHELGSSRVTPLPINGVVPSWDGTRRSAPLVARSRIISTVAKSSGQPQRGRTRARPHAAQRSWLLRLTGEGFVNRTFGFAPWAMSADTNRPRPEGVGLGRPLEGAVHVGKAPPGPAR